MIIIHDYIYTVGGAEKVLLDLIQTQDDKALYTSFTLHNIISNHSVFRDLSKNVQINDSYVLSRLAQIRRLIPFLRKLSLLYWLSTKIDAYHQDVIVSYTGGSSIFAHIKNQGKLIIYLHKIPSFAFYPTRNPLKLFLKNRLRASLNKFDFIITNSEYNKAQIMRCLNIGPERITVVYPIVRIPHISEGMSDPSERSYYIYIGRLEKYKGIKEITEFCARNKINLKVVGEGYLKDRLIRSQYIEYLGFVDENTKFKLLSKAKALITAGGDREEFGITAAESILSGTPVIAVAKGGVSEVVEDGKTGILIRNLNDEQITTAISRLNTLNNAIFKLSQDTLYHKIDHQRWLKAWRKIQNS